MRNKYDRILTFIKNNLFSIVTYVICALILITNISVLQFCRAVSGCMEPMINVGDVIVNTRFFRSVERGDIVTFSWKENDIAGKRVIGLPGEEVSFRDGYVYINQEQLDEPYLDSTIETNCKKTFVVPENSYFVMGDNRLDSFDSRYWENPYISIDDIQSKFICVVYRSHKRIN